MANAWKRDRPRTLSTSKAFVLILSASLLILISYFLTQSSNPGSSLRLFTPQPTIKPFDCKNTPQAHPVIANVVEGLKYPFLYSLSDFGTLPEKPHKNIVRILKGKSFKRPDISATVQDVLRKMKGEGKSGLVVDVGANVGIAAFAATAMGFRVVAFEPVLENLQRICDGIYLNRVEELVTVFEAAASDQLGNITFHKLVGRLDNSAVSASGANLVFKSNKKIAFQVKSIPVDKVIPETEPVLLLKIDVQGWEYHVLKGASKLLSRKKGEAPYIIYEEDERLLKESNSSSGEIRDFLLTVGYKDCTKYGTDTHCIKKI